MTPEERNKFAKNYVNKSLSDAQKLTETDFPEFNEGDEIYEMLSDLIEVNAKGFRGIVLTAIVGLEIDPNFDPLTRFYDCNPRPLFEQGIYFALTENKIPCGKSDPLNVAKNIYVLDKSWAEGKRPRKAAEAAVNYLEKVVNSENRNYLIQYFLFRLLKYAESINQYEIKIPKTEDETKRSISEKITEFIISFPEGGSIPQFIIGEILESIYENSEVQVYGGNESVYGTNTTSKKPADIWTDLEGEIINLYEITVKTINQKRLEDSFNSLLEIGEIEKPVTFICRIPEDTKDISLINGTYCHRNKVFEFIDIRKFIVSTSSLLSKEQMKLVIQKIESFIKHENISMKTKKGWNKIFS